MDREGWWARIFTPSKLKLGRPTRTLTALVYLSAFDHVLMEMVQRTSVVLRCAWWLCAKLSQYYLNLLGLVGRWLVKLITCSFILSDTWLLYPNSDVSAYHQACHSLFFVRQKLVQMTQSHLGWADLLHNHQANVLKRESREWEEDGEKRHGLICLISKLITS